MMKRLDFYMVIVISKFQKISDCILFELILLSCIAKTTNRARVTIIHFVNFIPDLELYCSKKERLTWDDYNSLAFSPREDSNS